MTNVYAKARFLTSSPGLAQAPPDRGREVAFAGRSNAGKSSALNVICAQRNLARTSKTPGRTRLINFLEWQRHLADYLERRRSLVGLVVLMDIRHPLTDYDMQILQWAAAGELPVHVLLTKADKLKRGPAKAALLSVRKALEEAGIVA